MLFSPVAPALYPFFGTLKECKEKQAIWEQKLKDEFSKLSKDRQNEILKNMELAGL